MVIPLMALLCAVGFASAASAAEYRWDFLTGHFDNLSLTPLGKGAVNLLRPTPRGLEVRVPAGEATSFVGFSARFKIRGDFEASMQYEIVRIATPNGGSGSGPSLYLTTETEGQPAAELSRLHRPDEKNIYNIFTADVVEGERLKSFHRFDATGREGMLKISRTGDEVSYWIAEEGQEPRQLATEPFDPADVMLLRFGLKQSTPQSSASVLIRNVVVRADELPELPSANDRTAQLYRPRYEMPESPPDRTWIWYLAAAIAVGAAAGTWLTLRIRARRTA